MNKYDFGYNIQAGSTTEWAYNIIQNKKEVLEIGPSIGTLAKHLKEDKHCLIDIVEIDAEAGEKAKQFARHSCIGKKEGDIENTIWYENYKGNQYDYIVLLDVIEHLRYPAVLLERLLGLLKDDGKLLITTPNIAHNSVLLNLFNNKFEYTSVGILDNTHLKFFTYSSFCDLLHNAGYVIKEKNFIQLRVGENEIKCDYSVVPREVEAYLRKRKMADVYQFMFILQKNGDEAPDHLPENLSYTNFRFETYSKGKLVDQIFFSGNTFKIRIGLKKERDTNFRIDPIDTNAIISEVLIWDVEKACSVPIKCTNGGTVKENCFAFFDNDPQIIIDTTETGSELEFSCHFEAIDSKGISLLEPLWREVLEKNSQLLDREAQFQVLENKYYSTEHARAVSDGQLKGVREEFYELQKKYQEECDQNKELQNQLDCLEKNYAIQCNISEKEKKESQRLQEKYVNECDQNKKLQDQVDRLEENLVVQLGIYEKEKKQSQKMQRDYQKECEGSNELQEQLRHLEEDYAIQCNDQKELKEKNFNQRKEIEELTAELETIKNTKAWKVYTKIRGIGH